MFCYKSLPIKDGEMRLVCFESHHDPPKGLKLRLFKQGLCYEAPSEGHGPSSAYLALSYVWGIDTPKEAVQLNGDELLINKNLYTALEHLRRLESDLPIWIDAICINQEDTTERADQVVRMKSIYENASKVIVWLGEERPGTTRSAVNTLNGFQTGFDGWLTIGQDLLKREWWSRMWVIQEIAVAREVEILCGPLLFSWWQLARAEQKARTDNIPIFDHTEDERTKGNVYLANVGAKSQYRLRFWAKQPLPILELLMNNLSCRATDSRDMIYSLISFATDVKSITGRLERIGERGIARISANAPGPSFEFVCDYDKPVETVYTDFVVSHASAYQSLDIICFSRQAKSLKGLPSWVPDWSNARETCSPNPFAYPGLSGPEYRYNASSGLSPSFAFRDHVLETTGIVMDTVTMVGSPWVQDKPPGEEFYTALRQWRQLALGVGFRHTNDMYTGGGTNHDAFIRTITADQDNLGRRIRIENGYFDPVVCFDPDGTYDENRHVRAYVSQPGFRDLERAAYLRMTRRRLFVTEKGYFGLGNPELDVGDDLAILSGCSVPMALRKKTSVVSLTEFSGPQEYSLIGETFVLGWMDGDSAQECYELRKMVIT